MRPWAFLILATILVAPTAIARDTTSLVLGVSGGARTGAPPRIGPDVSLLFGECRDSCGGYGATIGVINPKTEEYFFGLAAGIAYLGSVWVDLTVRTREGEPVGAAFTYAMGFALMGYLGAGYDAQRKTPFGELGLTFKFPVTGI